MVKLAFYLTAISVSFFILGVVIPNQVQAQTACQNTSGCTLRQTYTIKEYNLDADGNAECFDERTDYNCNGTLCYQDSTTCSETQLVCNNGAGNTPNDGYTCNNYCNDLAKPANCGNYGASDPRPTCQQYIQECLNQYCRPAGGGNNYTCPNSQVCISPPDPKAHQCITPVTPSSPSTCPIGPAEGGITYSCQTGSSCPLGDSRSGLYTCSTGNTCCWSSTIKYKCVNNACSSDNGDGTGTYSISSDCTAVCTSPATPPTTPPNTTPVTPVIPPTPGTWCHIGPASSTGSNSGTASVTYSGFDRMDWMLNGILANPNTTTDLGRGSSNNFTNLSPNTTYTVTGIGWCQNCTNNSVNCSGDPSFRTGGTTPPPPGNLQCFVPVGGAGEDIDIGRWRTGDPGGARRESSPNMNLNGTSGYRAGEGCYRPSRATEPTSGDIGGYVYVRDYQTTNPAVFNTYSQATMDFAMTFYWIYSTLPNAAPMCGMNNNQWCFTAAANPWMWLGSTGTSYPGGKVNGDTGSALYQGNNVTLISWDPRYKPVGYYEYQGDSTPEGCEGTCDYTCGEVDRRFKPWSHPMVNGAYNWQSSAQYCDTQGNRYASGSNLSLPNYSLTARVDFLFQKLGKFPVQGTVYKDNNRDGVKQDTETTPIPNANITLTGVGSTQTDANGHYLFTNVTEGSYTISAQADSFYPTNPVNGTAAISFTAPITQDFLMKRLYKIQGTVRQTDSNGNCPDTQPGYLGAILTLTGGTPSIQPQSRPTTGSGAYQFLNLDQGIYSLSVVSQTNSSVRPSSSVSIPLVSDRLNTDFCVDTFRPWAQFEGDIHSNTKIDLPAAPTR